MVRKMSAKEARDSFSDVLGAVYYSHETIIVEKQGRPFAIVINPDEYERLLKARRERFAVLERIRAKSRGVAPEEIEADVAREVAAARQESK